MWPLATKKKNTRLSQITKLKIARNGAVSKLKRRNQKKSPAATSMCLLRTAPSNKQMPEKKSWNIYNLRMETLTMLTLNFIKDDI